MQWDVQCYFPAVSTHLQALFGGSTTLTWFDQVHTFSESEGFTREIQKDPSTRFVLY
jgi:hypothetical protein